MPDTRLRILTWHVHGNYLYYLSQLPHDITVITRPGNPPGYGALGPGLPWGDNIDAVAHDQLASREFDCVIFQSRSTWEDARELLSPEQLALPRIYIEHDPPQQHPTNTPHWFQDKDGMLVHVTPFNALMWDSGITPTRVIDHGVIVPPGVQYQGTDPKGIVVVNHLKKRGRRLGEDVFDYARQHVALDLVGMDAESAGGLGEIPNLELAGFMARYRYFFNPIRYTSMGLAVVEAMMVGLPIIGLATTEMATAVRNEETGYVDTRPERLVEVMQMLARESDVARRWGQAARSYAQQRFGIGRFIDDWQKLFADMGLIAAASGAHASDKAASQADASGAAVSHGTSGTAARTHGTPDLVS